jgi:pSer/pThr/pTyr-binding forkhead associated (FHA) protein
MTEKSDNLIHEKISRRVCSSRYASSGGFPLAGSPFGRNQSESVFRRTMACVIICVGGHEVVRRRLDRPLVIGRSTECDVSIGHSLLSRHHCKIEFDGTAWVASDLKSLNGVWLESTAGTERLHSRLLQDGDHLRIGVAHVFFDAGAQCVSAPLPRSASRRRKRRPAEPIRRGTLASRELVRSRPAESPVISSGPVPRPRPRDPVAYQRDKLYSLFACIAVNSSGTESKFSPANRPKPHPRPSSRLQTSHEQLLPNRQSFPRKSRRREKWLVVAAIMMMFVGLMSVCAHHHLS